jgi:hypothetical protein
VTVVLTGDVHQWIDTSDRAYSDETESSLAVRYATIAGDHGLKVTLFFTGRAVLEDAAAVDTLVQLGNVELGGHGWDSFRPEWRYRVVNKLFRSPHGSKAMQARMVRRTCSVISHATSEPVLSWRNHAYTHDVHTPAALEEEGIRVWSDLVDLERSGPYHEQTTRITVLPINTTPDHEHVYHGDQTVDAVPSEKRSEYDHPSAWGERVARQVERVRDAGGVATILAHPLCMEVADEWQTFERLCAALAEHPSSWAREAEAVPAETL